MRYRSIMNQYPIRLNDQQHQWLTTFTRTGKHPAQAITRARILLLADKNTLSQSDFKIAQTLGVQTHTVQQLRKKFNQHGLENTIHRKTRKDKGKPVKIDGRVEAQIVKIACSSTSNNEPVWTLRMIADQLVGLEIVESIAHESVRRTLKKMNSNRI